MGDSLEKERERERNKELRECIESFSARSKEVGVGFTGSGMVVRMLVRRMTSAA